MKKMRIIAAMVSVMLIPAQMEANNKVNNKPKVEFNNKKNDKKFKDDKKFDNKKNDYKNFDKKKKEDKKLKNDKKKNNLKKQPKKQDMIKVPAPRQLPQPAAQVNVVYNSNPVNAVASVIGLAALAAIIAN